MQTRLQMAERERLAKMNNLDLYEYFLDIINTTAKWPPNTPLEKYRDLLPDRWKPRKSL